MSLTESEFTALRATIASRGTVRMVLLPVIVISWASLAIADARVVAITSGDAAEGVAYNLLSIGDTALKTAGAKLNAEGNVLNADVSITGNRMYIAAMRTKGVSVLAFDDFAGTPKLIKEKSLEREFRVKNFMGGIFDVLRDGYVAIAANNTRVGLVWMTGANLKAGEEIGGWAVLSCQ